MINHSVNTDECLSPTSIRSPMTEAIILAAGKGTRMTGDLPKAICPVANQPMIRWIIQACLDARIERCIVVVGYRSQDVRKVLEDQPRCVFVEQHEQLGTGHAALMAKPLFDPYRPSSVVVLPGDGPLITPQTLLKLIETHCQANASATLATAILDRPDGYGRVIRDTDGSFQSIIEQKDATEQQRQVKEINTGYYCFRSDTLFDSLSRVSDANAQGEYYLTDVPGMLKQAGHAVAILDAVPPQEVLGVNDRQQLAHADQILRDRLAAASATASNRQKERA